MAKDFVTSMRTSVRRLLTVVLLMVTRRLHLLVQHVIVLRLSRVVVDVLAILVLELNVVIEVNVLFAFDVTCIIVVVAVVVVVALIPRVS
jgi:hypothetical protein